MPPEGSVFAANETEHEAISKWFSGLFLLIGLFAAGLVYWQGKAMVNRELAAQMMHKLKEIGIKLAIDDFGTGYSSLSVLKNFPIDYLKIDRSFVTDLNTNASDAAIAKAVISMAHSLNLRVIAEGVETKEQLLFLHGYACEEMQGYYFSAPVSVDKMGCLLQENLALGSWPALSAQMHASDKMAA